MTTFADLDLLDCANCSLEAGPLLPGADRPAHCTHCGKKVAAYLFPVLLRPAAAPASAAAIMGAESSCFYHANKRASVACDGCGRFLCELCDVQDAGAHRCARCIDSAGQEKKTLRSGQRYVYYDSIAMAIAFAGLLFSIFSFVLAPLALYFVVRHWNSPRSIMPRSRWRFVVASGVAGAQLLAIAFFFISIFA